MHLHAAALAVPQCHVAPGARVEIGVGLAVGAREQVEVELRRHAATVVIGRDHDLRVLDQVHAQQEAVQRARMTQKSDDLAIFQIADGRARKESHRVGVGGKASVQAPVQASIQSEVETVREARHDRLHGQSGKIRAQARARMFDELARYVDGLEAAGPLQGAEQDAHLVERARAIFHHCGVRPQKSRHLARMGAQKRGFRARGIIFRQLCDRLEQLAAAPVVEPARADPPRGQGGEQIAREGAHEKGLMGRAPHRGPGADP